MWIPGLMSGFFEGLLTSGTRQSSREAWAGVLGAPIGIGLIGMGAGALDGHGNALKWGAWGAAGAFVLALINALVVTSQEAAEVNYYARLEAYHAPRKREIERARAAGELRREGVTGGIRRFFSGAESPEQLHLREWERQTGRDRESPPVMPRHMQKRR